MSDSISSKCVCIVDNGLFFSLALALSQQFNKNGFGRVLYCTQWDEQYPALAECVSGDGFESVERCDDYMRHVDDINLFCFPQRGLIGPQLLLEKMGKRVLGSRTGTELEIYRTRLRKLQAKLGMDVPDYVMVRGITALRKHLRPLSDKWIKTDRFRKDMETWHWLDWGQSEANLDKLAVKFGPFRELVAFMVEDPIDTDLEIGADCLCVDGKIASHAINGVECKDKSYVAFLKKYSDMPAEISAVLDPLMPTLKEMRYRNFLSTEQRVKGNFNCLTDLTPRAGYPSANCQWALYGNLPELVWHAAAGELIPIEPTASVAIECLIDHNDDERDWRGMRLPDEVLPWIAPLNPCLMDGVHYTPPNDVQDTCIGSLIGIGNSIKEAKEHIAENAEMLSGLPLTVHLDTLESLEDELEEANKEGIELAEKPKD